jgi:hypothetical protein
VVTRHRSAAIVNLVILLLALVLPASAASPDEILTEARTAQRVDRSIQHVRMVLISKGGSERVREFDVHVRRDGDVLKTWTRFTAPADVAGTQLVVVDNPQQVDEMLLYMPALKRVNRIAGKARSGAFMGSDFRYEDLEMAAAEDATATLVSEDAATWVLDARPADDSSYGRLRIHVSKSDYLPRRIEFFDKKDLAIKVLDVLEVVREGDVPLPIRSEMTDLKRGTKTRLEVLSHRLNVPAEEIPDETFTAAWMERSL